MTPTKDFPGLRRITSNPLKLRFPVPSDIEIAQEAELKPLAQVAEEVGLLPDEIEFHGRYEAKVRLEVLERLKDVPDGIYALRSIVDPGNQFREMSRSNNVAIVYLDIAGNRVSIVDVTEIFSK